jgi:hypothetical protein
MPQLVKGGKWVFGWVVVGPDGSVRLPPEAWREYGFEAGGVAIFVRGGRRSGGFALSRPALWAASLGRFGAASRGLGQGQFGEDGRLTLPSQVGVQPGQRLLVVRGSGHALGFVTRGPIYEEALRHPEIEVFEQEV